MPRIHPGNLLVVVAAFAITCHGEAAVDDDDSCLMQTRFSVANPSALHSAPATSALESLARAAGSVDGWAAGKADAVNYTWAAGLLLIALALFVGTWLAGSWLSAAASCPRDPQRAAPRNAREPEMSPSNTSPQEGKDEHDDFVDYPAEACESP